MKIVIKANTEEECRAMLFNRFNLTGDTSKSLYGHYNNRFIHEMYSEFNGHVWKTTFEVGKESKKI